MDSQYKLIDININRAAEALRILEDHCRYSTGLLEAAGAFKRMRSTLRRLADPLGHRLLLSRQADSDPGPQLARALGTASEATGRNVADINALRVQEALRALEEYFKSLAMADAAECCEAMRFDTYTLQRQLALCCQGAIRRAQLATDLYGITAEAWSLGRSNEDIVAAMLRGGIRIIQYREKQKTMLEKYRQCLTLRQLTADAGALFIVNDHADLALAVEADGVHIGQDDMPPAAVRDRIGEDRLLGISTHSPEQAQRAVSDGADYIGVGPLYSTQTKVDVCSPVGLGYLEYAVRQIPIPMVAIGGIKKHNLGDVISRGATCVALVTEIVGAQHPEACIQELRSIIQGVGKKVEAI